MNRINIKRMLVAGLAMFIMWVALEILIEGIIADFIFGHSYKEMLLEVIEVRGWSGLNYWVNIFIALVNCTVLIWLYASLRPMFGVGTRTALITSAFCVIWGFSMFINFINLGLFPLQLGLIEAVFEAVELPIAMMAGAAIYEGQEKRDRSAG